MLQIAKQFIAKRNKILTLAQKYSTPFYLIDEKGLRASLHEFKTAFDNALPHHQAFYAVKANYHPYILKAVVRQGFGLDVSSGRELQLALVTGAKQIIFSGPGKTEEELELALKHTSKLIVNLDSFGELDRLGKLARKTKKQIRTGVRIFSRKQGTWSKFGILLKDLKKFLKKAEDYPEIKLQGVQFHSSGNLRAKPYIEILRELSSMAWRGIKFIDLGGGFREDAIEGRYPWSYHPLPHLGLPLLPSKAKSKARYLLTRAARLEEYARGIGAATKKYFGKFPDLSFYTEPGRIIAAKSTHLIMKVTDVKDGLVITDAGTNMMGWEFGQYFYYPIINLSNPAAKELSMKIFGSLCTPRDFWGHYIYAKKIRPGDVIVIPNQGAYKFSLAQEFIKSIPRTYIF